MLVPRPRHLAILVAMLLAAATPACSSSGSGSSGGSAESTPARMSFEVLLLDDQPDPFATLPADAPKGIAPFQEVVIFSPESVESRTFVRLVVQPGETWPQAKARARPWFDKVALPAGDRLVFSEIDEENEVTKKREPVGARTFIATSTVLLGRDDVAEARIAVVPDPEDKPQPVTKIQLTPAAGERFAQFTRANVFRRLGVMIDGNLMMAARIQEEISGGLVQISMDPEIPFEARRAELQRIADGLSPAKPAAALSK